MSVVVTGYASLDYAVRLDRPPRPDTTATILSRPDEWPRLGGSPAYVAAALVEGGVRDAIPISWVADDADGARYRTGLARCGVRTDGIAFRSGRTPVCILAYQPDGACHCLYDPGLAEPIALDTAAARARRRRRLGLSDDRTRRGDPRRSRRGPAGCQGRLGRQGRCARGSRRPCSGHRRAGGSRRVQPRRGRVRRQSPLSGARKSDLKSSLRRAVARASRFRRAGAKMSFQSSRSRRTTRPAPATRSWAASSRPRF